MDQLVLELELESDIELAKLVIEQSEKKEPVTEWVVKRDLWTLGLAQVEEEPVECTRLVVLEVVTILVHMLY